MNAAYSPGTWKVGKVGMGYAIYAVNGRTRVRLFETFRTSPEARADARLVAAAPEMLATLKELVRWHENMDAPDECWMRARAVIAAVEGESDW